MLSVAVAVTVFALSTPESAIKTVKNLYSKVKDCTELNDKKLNMKYVQINFTMYTCFYN